MKVLIAGGGIGGLTTALSCQHFGHDVTVFEQSESLEKVGAGIQVPPNAMKVFKALGMDGDIAKYAVQPERIEARMGETGRQIFTIPLAGEAVQRWGAPYLHIHRADYIQALGEALNDRAPGALQTGARVEHYTQDVPGVSVKLSDGRKLTGDVLIGADGIHSVVRSQMIGPDRARFTGNVAWRAVVPLDVLGDCSPAPTACVWMGRGRHAVTYRLRRGELANFVGVVERDGWTMESWSEPGSKEEALRDFAGWHPVITNLIESVAPEKLYRWALFDREPLASWVDGRVALLGDAAHPMLPFLAQGAAMAVEDSWVLARELAGDQGSATDKLRTYQTLRQSRTARAQSGSRANMKTFHKRTWPTQCLAYGPMWLAGHIMPSLVHKRMDWLYGYDVTASM